MGGGVTLASRVDLDLISHDLSGEEKLNEISKRVKRYLTDDKKPLSAEDLKYLNVIIDYLRAHCEVALRKKYNFSKLNLIEGAITAFIRNDSYGDKGAARYLFDGLLYDVFGVCQEVESERANSESVRQEQAPKAGQMSLFQLLKSRWELIPDAIRRCLPDQAGWEALVPERDDPNFQRDYCMFKWEYLFFTLPRYNRESFDNLLKELVDENLEQYCAPCGRYDGFNHYMSAISAKDKISLHALLHNCYEWTEIPSKMKEYLPNEIAWQLMTVDQRWYYFSCTLPSKHFNNMTEIMAMFSEKHLDHLLSCDDIPAEFEKSPLSSQVDQQGVRGSEPLTDYVSSAELPLSKDLGDNSDDNSATLPKLVISSDLTFFVDAEEEGELEVRRPPSPPAN